MPRRSVKLQMKIEALMDMVPPTPKGFENWMLKSGMKDQNFMFYKKKGPKLHCLCSHCGQFVDVKKANHNNTGRCPSCKAKVTYKAINKAKYYDDSEIMSIIQKMDDEHYVVRYFKVRRTYKWGDDTSYFPSEVLPTLTSPEVTIWEGSREVIKVYKLGGWAVDSYEELYNWETKQYEWRREHKRSSFFNKELLRDSNPFMYKRNLKGILKNSEWKYCGLDHFTGKHMNITNYLWAYNKYPVLEMLSKLGYNRLLKHIIHMGLYWGGIGGLLDTSKKYLGLNKEVFTRALRLKLDIYGIEFINTLWELGRQMTDKQVMWVINNANTEIYTQVTRFVSPQKAINYVSKHTPADADRMQFSDRRHFMTTWRDYLTQCVSLNMDMKSDFVLFPKNLNQKHDELTRLIKAKEDKVINEGIMRQYDKWNEQLSYQAGQLSIEVAATHKLIIDESSALRHCVGTGRYAERMAKGENLILFIRKAGKPYHTVEFNHEEVKIVQNRGFRNKAPTKDVEKFINKWKVKRLLSMKKMTEAAV